MEKDRFTLYYFPTSYYSHLVIVALLEKKAVFKEKVINILNDGQLTPTFVRLNNKAEVPVLRDGDKVIVESRDIVDYIDKEISAEPRLVPDKTTEVGMEIERVRGILGKVPIELLSYGCMFHPDISSSGLKLPKAFQREKKEMEEALSVLATTCAELADKYPDLRDAYLAKNQYFTKKIEMCSDKQRVMKAVEDLEKTFDQMESLLKQNKKEGTEDTWIVGSSFSAADISLATLLGRIFLLGLDPKFLSEEKRPELFKYWARVSERPSIKKTILGASKATAQYLLKQKAKIVLPIIGGLATVGIAAGVAALLLVKKFK